MNDVSEPTTDRIERSIELNVLPSRVWRALTDHREFGEWFRVQLDGPFLCGETVRGRVSYPGYEHILFDILVERIEPERCFSFRWHPHPTDLGADYSSERMTLVEFRLEPTAGGTLLTVVESGFDGIPAARRDEAFRGNSKGWEIQMQNIAAYVAAM